MSFAVQVLAHTPVYVFVLFAYLVWQGVRSLRPRSQSIRVMLIAPGAFAASALLLLVRGIGQPWGGAAWLCAALAAAPLGLATGPRLLAADRVRSSVTRAGSPVPLLRNLVVFALQYAIAAGAALHPASHAAWDVAGAAVSGLSIGYFAGWGLTFRRRYREAAADQSVITSAQ